MKLVPDPSARRTTAMSVSGNNVGIQSGDCRVVPLLNLAKVDVAYHFAGERQITDFDTGEVDNRDDAADNGRELKQPGVRRLVIFHRCVRTREVDCIRNDLPNTTRRTDTLIVHLGAA